MQVVNVKIVEKESRKKMKRRYTDVSSEKKASGPRSASCQLGNRVKRVPRCRGGLDFRAKVSGKATQKRDDKRAHLLGDGGGEERRKRARRGDGMG